MRIARRDQSSLFVHEPDERHRCCLIFSHRAETHFVRIRQRWERVLCHLSYSSNLRRRLRAQRLCTCRTCKVEQKLRQLRDQEREYLHLRSFVRSSRVEAIIIFSGNVIRSAAIRELSSAFISYRRAGYCVSCLGDATLAL